MASPFYGLTKGVDAAAMIRGDDDVLAPVTLLFAAVIGALLLRITRALFRAFHPIKQRDQFFRLGKDSSESTPVPFGQQVASLQGVTQNGR
jgi:hypothetical protein